MLRSRALAAVVAAVLFLYAADWAAWRVRAAGGHGLDTVEVSQVSVASLKGNKEEYYSDATVPTSCSRSVFPVPTEDGWTTPCWWLRRHAQVMVRH